MDDKSITGIIRIFIALGCLPLHIIMIWLFTTKPDYQKRMSFKIMKMLGVADSLHLVAQLAGACMAVFETNVNEIFERVAGAIVNSSWDGMIGMIFVLALNRVVVVTQVKMAIYREKGIFYTLSAIIWFSYLSVIGLHLTNEGAVEYGVERNCFHTLKTDLNHFLNRWETYIVLALLALSLCCYIVIVAWLVLNNNVRSKRIKIERREMRFLAQAMIVFGYMFVLRGMWYFGKRFYMKDVTVADVLVVLSCLIGGINPLLYLCFIR
ncbi:hypothetical protein QR680_015511 [Steinernema hermaphroditum]|uniref:Uncharacterized protein n=1 Tax=Steinernema hermaphroditum TaxID=289476 RepID=A0AA39H9V6_9BILA|nr:hypothetical protein QR680_015511 [Steinernema hermaphroditum]